MKKIIILLRANVAADVAGVKMCRHIAVYVHATWCTRMLSAQESAHMYAFVHKCVSM